jgi:Flp pilus assembly protein TadD
MARISRWFALSALACGAGFDQARQDFWNGDYDAAIQKLEQAVASDPANSAVHHWLGKSYGRKAETSSFLTAFGWARKCRVSFEKAVSLDAANTEAMSDLMEFYLAAPSLIGGGYRKAEQMAARIAAINPPEGEFARHRLAETKKDFASAESHLRKALALEPEDIGRKLDLATFLYRRGRAGESEAIFTAMEQTAKVIFARAQAYVEAKRNLPQARRMLEQYLGMNLSLEDSPPHEARALLNKIR